MSIRVRYQTNPFRVADYHRSHERELNRELEREIDARNAQTAAAAAASWSPERVHYERLKNQNPFAAARYLSTHRTAIFAPKPTPPSPPDGNNPPPAAA